MLFNLATLQQNHDNVVSFKKNHNNLSALKQHSEIMAKIEKFEDLDIWKLAVSIAVDIYLLCDKEPLKSDWGMKDQIRRAACSMSDNIAEGFEYNNNPDFIRFLNYAKGSSGEFRNKLTILNLSGKIDDGIFNNLYTKSIEFSGKTKSLIDYLKKFEANKKAKRGS